MTTHLLTAHLFFATVLVLLTWLKYSNRASDIPAFYRFPLGFATIGAAAALTWGYHNLPNGISQNAIIVYTVIFFVVELLDMDNKRLKIIRERDSAIEGAASLMQTLKESQDIMNQSSKLNHEYRDLVKELQANGAAALKERNIFRTALDRELNKQGLLVDHIGDDGTIYVKPLPDTEVKEESKASTVAAVAAGVVTGAVATVATQEIIDWVNRGGFVLKMDTAKTEEPEVQDLIVSEYVNERPLPVEDNSAHIDVEWIENETDTERKLPPEALKPMERTPEQKVKDDEAYRTYVTESTIGLIPTPMGFKPIESPEEFNAGIRSMVEQRLAPEQAADSTPSYSSSSDASSSGGSDD